MLKSIETVYNGYRFRNRLEARWAMPPLITNTGSGGLCRQWVVFNNKIVFKMPSTAAYWVGILFENNSTVFEKEQEHPLVDIDGLVPDEDLYEIFTPHVIQTVDAPRGYAKAQQAYAKARKTRFEHGERP